MRCLYRCYGRCRSVLLLRLFLQRPPCSCGTISMKSALHLRGEQIQAAALSLSFTAVNADTKGWRIDTLVDGDHLHLLFHAISTVAVPIHPALLNVCNTVAFERNRTLRAFELDVALQYPLDPQLLIAYFLCLVVIGIARLCDDPESISFLPNQSLYNLANFMHAVAIKKHNHNVPA